MTEIELQQAVAAYVNRDVETFLQGSPAVNLLRVAINNAKKWAQRKLNFELARTSVLVSCNVNTGGDLTTAVSQLDGITPVKINVIERAYLGYGQPGDSPLGVSYRPLAITSKQHAAFRQSKSWEGVSPDTTTSDKPRFCGIREPALIRQGNQIFVTPVTSRQDQSTPIYVGLDVVAWLPDYDDSVQTDFLLENCQDWLMYRTIRELNYFIKDANRVVVTGGLVTEAWENVVEWNGSLMSDDDNDLN